MLAKLSSFFSLLALLLACIGLYGVMSYDVARRTHEIGIRMALGATGKSVRWMVLRQSMPVVFVGIAMGLCFVRICARLIASFLYGLSSTDAAAMIFSASLLILVALLACYIPARRASRVDLMIVLRYE